MTFLWTTLKVHDVPRSIAFYTDVLELRVLQRFSTEAKTEIVFLGNGNASETTVELIEDKKFTPSANETISLGFKVPSLDEMKVRLSSMGISIVGNEVETPKFRFITVQDPNGVFVQLFQYK